MIYASMTAPQLAAIDRDSVIVLIPIAAVEQHGPHMPVGTDTLICSAITSELECRCTEKILLTPPLWLGASAHHLRFGSTLNTELDTYVSTLCDIARSLLDDGFQRLLFVNGHGGNIDPLRIALRQLQPEYPAALLVGGPYWSVADDLIRSELEGDHRFVGHACEFETSLIMHLHPDLVDTERISDAGHLVPDTLDGLFVSRDMRQRTREGFTGRPDLASADKGNRLFEGLLTRLQNSISAMLAEPLGTEYDEFTS